MLLHCRVSRLEQHEPFSLPSCYSQGWVRAHAVGAGHERSHVVRGVSWEQAGGRGGGDVCMLCACLRCFLV